MALTSGSGNGHDGRDGPDPGSAVVDRAASALRAYTDHGWTAASPRILQSVLAATRRSRPVRARDDAGDLHVSDQVITTYLQAAVDEVDGVQATHIRLELDGDLLTALRITVTVRYPEPVHPLAESVRHASHETIRSVLGSALPLSRISIHIGDVDPP
ncbi:Asp23/Gls24 family envelope stress response protein [Jiangella alkaliphila]|uniref:Asp23 family, cell envelope-related function n=1 Tax=Jiangella alkaliphila TaxID=419479 RepID=A0A1H2LHA4_9ACTN|nr:Asp23/Gls24 family envelope stress response protein [Jiangella alkaliphila]SDU80443.1 hypothetical protein SAMN04488563_6169 [Jiangella alkaliphila]